MIKFGNILALFPSPDMLHTATAQAAHDPCRTFSSTIRLQRSKQDHFDSTNNSITNYSQCIPFTMAVAEKPTYTFIPLPPLPEFYLPKQDSNEVANSSSISDTHGDLQALVTRTKTFQFETPAPPASGDGTYDSIGPARAMVHVPLAPLMTIPPPPPTGNAHDVPPLAIYHICRICLRPRSPRYHREHPIPIDGLPPPPGICRRCRVTSVEETKRVDEVVFEGDSNEIKLGCIAPFVPDEAIVTNKEMKRAQAEKWLGCKELNDGYVTRERSRPRKDIVYRHVRVIEEPDDSAPRRKTKVAFTAQEAIENFNEQQMPEPPRAPKTTMMSMQVQPTENPPSAPAKTVESAAVAKIDSTKASVSSQASVSASRSASDVIVRATSQVASQSRSGRADFDIRKIAREEIESYSKTTRSPSVTDSHIRRLARDEVELYRVAERKIEAHPDPYSHGRMVPTERRIEVERDVVEVKPWDPPPKEERQETEPVYSRVQMETQTTQETPKTTAKQPKDIVRPKHSSAAPRAQPAELQSDGVHKSAKPKDNQRPKRDSWGPQWRRELSLERRKSVASDVRSQKRSDVNVEQETTKRKASAMPQSDPPTSVKLREIYDVVQRSDPPRWSSKAEPYVVKVVRERSRDNHNVIEVVEEFEIPATRNVSTKDRREPGSLSSGRQELPASKQSKGPKLDNERQDFQESNRPSRQSSERPVEITHSKSSKPTAREHSYGVDVVRNADSSSSKYYETSGSGGPSDEWIQKNDVKIKGSAISSPLPREIHAHESTISEKTCWPERQETRQAPQKLQVKQDERPPYPEDDAVYERIRRPTDTPTELSARIGPSQTSRSTKGTRSTHGSRSVKDSYVVYEYTVRTVQPADRPTGKGPFDDVPPSHRVVTEEISRTEREPEQEAQPPRQHRERRKPKVRDSEESNHVHFNSKVEISPTPPGSDASSSAFRSFHSFGLGNSRQVDGYDDRPESGEDLIAEYERRGRARNRDQRVEYDYHYERESLRERSQDRDQTVKPSRQEGERRYAVRTRRLDGLGQGDRTLDRALSESPSREFSISGRSSKKEKIDGVGPYRPEGQVTESMQVEDGSRGAWNRDEGERFVPRRDYERVQGR